MTTTAPVRAQAALDAQAIDAGRRMTVDELLARAARRTPARVALTVGQVSLTYAELHESVRRVAGGLSALGVGRGDRVLVAMHNRLEMVQVYFATVSLAAIAVPVNVRSVAAEVAHLLSDSEPGVCVSDEQLAEVVAAAAATTGWSGRFVGAGAPGRRGWVPWEQLLEGPPWAGDGADEDDTAFLMYTSGTTGAPKGAELTHRNLVVHTQNAVASLGIVDPDETVMSGMPLFHVGGLDILLYPLLGGGSTLLLETGGFDASRAVDLVAEHRVTTAIFVPTQVAELCAVPGVAARARSLRRIGWGASDAPRSVLEDLQHTFPGIEVYAVFGQTEMSASTCILATHLHPEKLGSVGRPVMNVEVRLVDEAMDDVAPGQVGEIVYRGPTVMKGYWRRPEATAAAFAGGWFHSGDLCRQDQDGFVHVVDRLTDMVVSGGENVYCAEVEAVIRTHPKVAAVAVVGVPHPRWVETPIAVVVPRDVHDPPVPSDVIAHTEGRLARYKRPSFVVVAQELPRNTLGKVQKFVLRDEYAGIAGSQTGHPS